MTVQKYIACILSAPLHFSESRHLWGKIFPITNIKTILIYLTFQEKCANIQTHYPHLLCLSILIKHIVGLSVCLSVCLFVGVNLSRLKSERHETRHVGPLGD